MRSIALLLLIVAAKSRLDVLASETGGQENANGGGGTDYRAGYATQELCKTLTAEAYGMTNNFSITQSAAKKFPDCANHMKALLQRNITSEQIVKVIKSMNRSLEVEREEGLVSVIEALEATKALDMDEQMLKRFVTFSDFVTDRIKFLVDVLHFAEPSWWLQFFDDREFMSEFNMKMVAEEIIVHRRYKSTLPIYREWTKTENPPKRCAQSTVMAILKFDAERNEPLESAGDFAKMFKELCKFKATQYTWAGLPIAEILQDKYMMDAPLKTVQLVLEHAPAHFRKVLKFESYLSSTSVQQYSLGILTKEVVLCADQECVAEIAKGVSDAMAMNIPPSTLRRMMTLAEYNNINKRQILNFLTRLMGVGFEQSRLQAEHFEYVVVDLFILKSYVSAKTEPTLHTGIEKLIKKTARWDSKSILDFVQRANEINLSVDTFEAFFDVLGRQYPAGVTFTKVYEIMGMFPNLYLTAQRFDHSRLLHKVLWQRMKGSQLALDLDRFVELSNAGETYKVALALFFANKSIKNCSPEVVKSVAEYDLATGEQMTAREFRQLYNEACTEADEDWPSMRAIIDGSANAGEDLVVLMTKVKRQRLALCLLDSGNWKEKGREEL